MKIEFITGGRAAVLGALDAEAEVMFGYPITPSSEILEGWVAETISNNKLKYLQTEDETTAGFALIGALLAGKRAFTATAGPGTILMQDPLSMAENLRLPFVAFVMMRGGPSTGTVNFSQQEVTLSAFGGNGDGLRVVYSASTTQELYELCSKSFSTAWKYRFPTIVLGDGHLAKMRKQTMLLPQLRPYNAKPILKQAATPTHLRNCFSSEESFYHDRLKVNISDWMAAKRHLAESEGYRLFGAESIIVAHGSVADTAKDAVDLLRKSGKKVGLWRPITLNPLDTPKLISAARKAKKLIIVESSLNQLSRIVKYELYGNSVPIREIAKPALGFEPNELVKLLMKEGL